MCILHSPLGWAYLKIILIVLIGAGNPELLSTIRLLSATI